MIVPVALRLCIKTAVDWGLETGAEIPLNLAYISVNYSLFA